MINDSICRSIVERIAEDIGEKIVCSAIRDLRKMDSGLSGEDSGLKNAWDEICVQVQGEQSIYWDTYLETIEALIAASVDELPQYQKQALWLVTPEGNDWSDEPEDDREPFGICIPDIEHHLCRALLKKAVDYENRRIRAYLDGDENVD